MTIEEAIKILKIVKCDSLGICRDLSSIPTPCQIGQAIETVLQYIAQYAKKRNEEN